MTLQSNRPTAIATLYLCFLTLTIRTQQEMSRILPLAPLDPIDLLFDFQRLEVVEFRFM